MSIYEALKLAFNARKDPQNPGYENISGFCFTDCGLSEPFWPGAPGHFVTIAPSVPEWT